MRREIDRKLYDTDQAEQIARYAPLTDREYLNYLVETLYKTADGEYFLHGDGGAATMWAEIICNQLTPGEEIYLLTDEEALDWCKEREIHCEFDLTEFEHLIET